MRGEENKAVEEIKKGNDDIQAPLSDTYISELAKTLSDKFKEEKRQAKYASIKEVLTILGQGIALGAMILAPKSAKAFKSMAFRDEYLETDWRKFNPSYLRRTLKHLEKQKQVEIQSEGGQDVIRITNQGKVRILRFALEDLAMKKQPKWDGKWRLVAYDVPNAMKKHAVQFRYTLANLGFCPFQESILLYPYPCRDEVEYLRQILGISEFVRILQVDHFENDSVFKTYFGLK